MKKIAIISVGVIILIILMTIYILSSPLSMLKLMVTNSDVWQAIEDFKDKHSSQAEEYGYYDMEDMEYLPGSIPVTYYNQKEEPWGSHPYGTQGTIKTSGCGPTSMAIVTSSFTGEAITPIVMADWSLEQGYRVYHAGTSRALMPAAAANWGLSCEGLKKDGRKVVEALSDGKLVVALMGPGDFTNGGHYIVLRGISEDGKIMVADPNSRSRSNMLWSISVFTRQAKDVDEATNGPFWAIWKPETEDVTRR